MPKKKDVPKFEFKVAETDAIFYRFHDLRHSLATELVRKGRID
jgi:hypothetical protein